MAQRTQTADFRAYETEPTPNLALGFSPNSKMIATGAYGDDVDAKPIRLWDVATGTRIRELEGIVACQSLTFDPSGKYLATTGVQMQAVLWNVETGQRTVNLGTAHNPTWLVTLSPDGQSLASLSFRGVYVWHPHEAQGKRLRLMITSTGKDSLTPALAGRGRLPQNAPVVDSQLTITCMNFSPDSRFLACGGTAKNINQIEIWDCVERKLPKVLVERNPTSETGKVSQIIFGPTGKSILAVSSNRLTCWNWETNQPLFVLQEKNRFVDIGMGRKVQQDPFGLVAVSADGRTMATVNRNSPIRLWDMPASWSEPK